MLKINWKVRIKNPVWLANMAAAIVLPILTYLGLEWGDMTSWGALGGALLEAVKNPVIIVAVLVSVWNLNIDPTTRGIGDSSRALTYTKPSK